MNEGAAQQPISSVTVVALNGRQFAAGLFWQPLTRLNNYMAEAREIGKREGMDIVAIRRAIPMQAGFVAKGQGVQKGMYSLAAALAGQLGASCVAAFEIDAAEDRYGLVAVHDNAIVPGCDLVATRDEVLNKLRAVYNYLNWEKVYAPASFQFGGEELDIKKALDPSNLKPEHRLRPLTFGLTRKELVVLSMVLLLGAAGLVGWLQWQEKVDREAAEAAAKAAAERRAELERLNANAKREMDQKSLEHPWAKQPAADDFVTGCVQRIDGLPLVVDGWVLQQAKCSGAFLSVSYDRRDGGTTNGFLAASANWFSSTPTIATSGDGALIDIPIELRVGGDEPLRTAAEATADLVSHFQRAGLQSGLSEKAAAKVSGPALPGHATTEQTARAPDWRVFGFKLETERSPDVVLQGMRTDGVRFTEVLVRLEAGAPKLTWSLTGDLYAK